MDAYQQQAGGLPPRERRLGPLGNLSAKGPHVPKERGHPQTGISVRFRPSGQDRYKCQSQEASCWWPPGRLAHRRRITPTTPPLSRSRTLVPEAPRCGRHRPAETNVHAAQGTRSAGRDVAGTLFPKGQLRLPATGVIKCTATRKWPGSLRSSQARPLSACKLRSCPLVWCSLLPGHGLTRHSSGHHPGTGGPAGFTWNGRGSQTAA